MNMTLSFRKIEKVVPNDVVSEKVIQKDSNLNKKSSKNVLHMQLINIYFECL